MEESVASLREITGASDSRARELLASCNGNVDQAIAVFFDEGESPADENEPAPTIANVGSPSLRGSLGTVPQSVASPTVHRKSSNAVPSPIDAPASISNSAPTSPTPSVSSPVPTPRAPSVSSPLPTPRAPSVSSPAPTPRAPSVSSLSSASPVVSLPQLVFPTGRSTALTFRETTVMSRRETVGLNDTARQLASPTHKADDSVDSDGEKPFVLGLNPSEQVSSPAPTCSKPMAIRHSEYFQDLSTDDAYYSLPAPARAHIKIFSPPRAGFDPEGFIAKKRENSRFVDSYKNEQDSIFAPPSCQKYEVKLRRATFSEFEEQASRIHDVQHLSGKDLRHIFITLEHHHDDEHLTVSEKVDVLRDMIQTRYGIRRKSTINALLATYDSLCGEYYGSFDPPFDLKLKTVDNLLLVQQSRGQAAQNGLRKGDILVSVNGECIANFPQERAYEILNYVGVHSNQPVLLHWIRAQFTRRPTWTQEPSTGYQEIYKEYSPRCSFVFPDRDAQWKNSIHPSAAAETSEKFQYDLVRRGTEHGPQLSHSEITDVNYALQEFMGSRMKDGLLSQPQVDFVRDVAQRTVDKHPDEDANTVDRKHGRTKWEKSSPPNEAYLSSPTWARYANLIKSEQNSDTRHENLLSPKATTDRQFVSKYLTQPECSRSINQEVQTENNQCNEFLRARPTDGSTQAGVVQAEVRSVSGPAPEKCARCGYSQWVEASAPSGREWSAREKREVHTNERPSKNDLPGPGRTHSDVMPHSAEERAFGKQVARSVQRDPVVYARPLDVRPPNASVYSRNTIGRQQPAHLPYRMSGTVAGRALHVYDSHGTHWVQHGNRTTDNSTKSGVESPDLRQYAFAPIKSKDHHDDDVVCSPW